MPDVLQQEQAHFIPSGTSLRRIYLNYFLHDASNSINSEEAKAKAPDPWSKSDLCAQRADWTSDHCYCHCQTAPVMTLLAESSRTHAMSGTHR